jgi:hypothetical protein
VAYHCHLFPPYSNILSLGFYPAQWEEAHKGCLNTQHNDMQHNNEKCDLTFVKIYCYADCFFMLSVPINPIMPSVVMLAVIADISLWRK